MVYPSPHLKTITKWASPQPDNVYQKLTRGIVECPEIADVYLRYPSRHDARCIVRLHKEQHQIDGMLGLLDVTKIHWANRPNAWKGHFKGKEGYPMIALEAVSDKN